MTTVEKRRDPIGWDQWNAIATSFYTSPSWLAFVDSDRNSESSYRLARGDGGESALVCHWNPAEQRGEYRYQDVLGGDGTPVLLGGRRGFHAPLIASGRPDIATLTELVTDAVEEYPGSRGRWWWPYLPDRDCEPVIEAARAAGHAGLHLLGASCALEITVDSIDAFIEQLAPKQRRTNARRERRAFAESGLRLRPMPLDEVVEYGAPLLGQVQRKYGHDMDDRYLRTFLDRQRQHLAASAAPYGIYDSDRLIGFSLGYVNKDEFAVRLVGMDYERLTGAAEYAHLLVYAPVQYCIDNGMTTVHFGKGSYEAKCRRGATATPVWAVAAGDPATAGFHSTAAASVEAGLPQRERHHFQSIVEHRRERWHASGEGNR